MNMGPWPEGFRIFWCVRELIRKDGTLGNNDLYPQIGQPVLILPADVLVSNDDVDFVYGTNKGQAPPFELTGICNQDYLF